MSPVKNVPAATRATVPWWETPRATALVVGVTAVRVGILAGLAGYKLGSTPAQPVQFLFQAEAIQVALGQVR